MIPPVVKKRPTSPYQDGRIRLEEYDVEGRDGRHHLRTVVRHPGAVVLLPVLDDGRIVMVRNFRLPLGKAILELPAGCLEKGEEIVSAAHRELAEETGYRAKTLSPLLSFYPSPGLLDERMDVFLAEGLEEGQRHLDPTEAMEVELWTQDALRKAIADGSLIDGKTLTALLFWWQKQAGGQAASASVKQGTE